MKIVRFEWEQDIIHGVIDGDFVFSIEGSIFDDFKVGKKLCSLGDVKLLAPIQPRLVVGVGANYYEMLKSTGMEIPKEPMLFFKPPSSVVGHLDNIIYPKVLEKIIYEAELAVVMKREASHVPEDKALEYVLGYTCGNDVTATGLGGPDFRHITRMKSFYTFCPLGPCIATDINPDNLRIRSWINGNLIGDNPTSDMIFKIPQIIRDVSEFMTLYPSDVILTGTAWKPEEIHIGDTIDIEIDEIGTFRNTVIQQ